MTKKFISKAKVKGSNLSSSIITDDTNEPVTDYENLIEVILKNEDFFDAYYFINEENADNFINPYL